MNTKMKVLSLALVGLVGTAFAGSALAVCPTSPVPPWADVQVSEGSATIATPGLASTDCRLDSTLAAGAGSFASALVHDDSPASEPRYRAAFIINADSLGAPTFSDAAQIFTATSASFPLRLSVYGNNTAPRLSYALGSGTSGSAALAPGENHVEFDLQVGASGSLTIWVNSNVEGSPTVGPVALDTSTMVGIDDAYLGLAAGTPSFRNTYGGVAVQFDQFDSRRTTFIGY